MTYASHMFCCSRKLQNAKNILRHEPAIFVRCFSKDAGACGDKGLIETTGQVPGRRNGGFDFPVGGTPSRMNNISYNSRAIDFGIFKMPLGELKGNFSRTTRIGIPMVGMGNNASSCLQASSLRGFSSDSGSLHLGYGLANNVTDFLIKSCKDRHVVSAGLPPHQEIGMPSLSPTMTEGNIARWLKKEGDKLTPGEVLCEVETDKATVEMECMEEGYLAKIIRGDGAKDIKVGEVIAITVEEEDDIAKFKDYQGSPSGAKAGAKEASESTPPRKEESQPVSSPALKAPKADESTQTEDRVFMSPLARKLAQDYNVPLSSIKGTGPDGRIVKADIEDYLASSAKGVAVGASKGAAAQTLDYSDIPLSQIRKVTAARLLQSKQTIPHYYLTVDTCVDKLMELRGQLNSIQEASGGKRISVNDLVIKAAALALRKVPQCNSSWANDYIRQYHNVNINVAVQTDNGLFVPVVRDADKKGLSKISEEVKHLAQKAKDNSLKPADYEGGTFTVSNLGGPFGIKQFCAIINPPQAAILAIGSAEKRVVAGAGADQFDFGSFMSVTLSCDHRVIDGAIGAEYLKAFKGYMENPHSMLL